MAAKLTPPLLVIVGQTASGKSALAMDIAKNHNGAIICADSRTIYKGMDIGTAKPTVEDRSIVQHYGLDIASLNDRFTASDFKGYANTAIAEVWGNGKLPIVVGGTGLYIDSLLYDFGFRTIETDQKRQQLEQQSVVQLQEQIRQKDLPMPQNIQNLRHLIRVIESEGEVATRSNLRANTYVVGLRIEKAVLESRIERRVTEMFAAGLLAEAKVLYEEFGLHSEALSGIGYREFLPFFNSEQTIEQVQRQIIVDTRRYAKRQMTWFKRNGDINWFDTLAAAEAAAVEWINNVPTVGTNGINSVTM
jgi:tRNA dimethylallyltransferase